MKIGIYDLNNCSMLNYKERLHIYKDAGFNSVGLYLDSNYMSNDESYTNIIEFARKIGLSVNQVHVDYKISNLICDDNDNTYFEYVETKLNECLNLNIPFMVLHASKGNDAPILTAKGIEKLKIMMKKYKDRDVFLCFENVRDNRNLAIIMEANINNVFMCYDMGHAYCYDNEYELLNRYKDKIICSHLHNNYKVDSHNTLFDGEINSKEIVSILNEIGRIDNCLETFPKKGDILSKSEFIEFVNKNYKDYNECLN